MAVLQKCAKRRRGSGAFVLATNVSLEGASSESDEVIYNSASGRSLPGSRELADSPAADAYVRIYIYTHIYIYIYIYIYICVCVCVYIYIYIYMCVCVCVYIY